MIYLSAKSAYERLQSAEHRTVLLGRLLRASTMALTLCALLWSAPSPAAAAGGSMSLSGSIVDVFFCAGGKIDVCHRSVSGREHTISVCRSSWPAHERHGDTLGPCGQEEDCVAGGEGICDTDSDSDSAGGHGIGEDSDSDSDSDLGAHCLTDADCDDGDVCNGVEVCGADRRCVAGEPIPCDDGDVCNGVETCDPERGCVPGTPLSCDDGVYCNGAETCDPSSGCRPGCPPCSDGVSCTIDTCDEATHECGHIAADDRCDDGDPCNGTEVCSEGGCVSAGDPVDCTSLDSFCGVGVCDESSGDCVVQPVNQGAECDDGDDACTLSDRCVDGQCTGTPVCDVECERCDGGACISLCGNPFDVSNDRVSVVDALFALRAAVELETCPLCRCDVNGDGVLGSTDALRILWKAVRLPVDFLCPQPGGTTTTTIASTTTSLPAPSTTLLD